MLPLPADGGVGAVAAKDGCLLGQIEELVLDAVHLCVEVAAGQVGTPYAPLEKRVAANQDLRIGNIEG